LEETETALIVRRGHVDEAEILARLHVSVWRATYRDYAPEEAMTILDEAKRLPYWSGALADQGPRHGVWVADWDGEVLAVASLGRSTHRSFGGRLEIKHFYVAEHAQGKGIGRRLLATLLQVGNDPDQPGIALAVVRQNASARGFYAKLGGKPVGEFTDPGPLWKSDNIVMAWD